LGDSNKILNACQQQNASYVEQIKQFQNSSSVEAAKTTPAVNRAVVALSENENVNSIT
jgi:hypothetical protein